MGSSSSRTNSPPVASMGSQLIESGHVFVDRYPACRFCKYVRMTVGTAACVGKIRDMRMLIDTNPPAIFIAAENSIASVSAIPVGIYLLAIGIPTFLLEFGKIIRLVCG